MLCITEACTGCEVCSLVCPTHSITMSPDKLGFLYPTIDQNTCIHCNKCTRNCHIMKEAPVNIPNVKKIYAVWNKEPEVRMNSTSGGAFSAVAESILEMGGYVVAAAYNESFDVIHVIAQSSEELKRQRGSKYVQSRMNNVLPSIKALVKEQVVLFCGTPCQVAAVKQYVGDSENLYTVDIVCHGVGAPAIFQKYLRYLEDRHNAKITEFRFRSKYNSWRYPSVNAHFEDQQEYFKSGLIDPMFVGFNRDVFLRESCYQCKYTQMDRPADITISDFWGYESLTADDIDDDYGVSMLMVNSLKGQKLFAGSESRMVVFERDQRQAMKGQPCLDHPTTKSPMRKAFLNDVDRPFEELAEKYFQPRYEYSTYYYYRANHSRAQSKRMKKLFRYVDAVSRRLHLQKMIITYLERKNKMP